MRSGATINAVDLSADIDRGSGSPPLFTDKPIFSGTVVQNESTMTEMGTGVLPEVIKLVLYQVETFAEDWASTAPAKNENTT